MIQELSERLSKIIEQKRLKEKLERDLHAVEMELQNKTPQLSSLGTQLEKEEVDVEKLESISLTYLFYSVLGSREQQLEKERQELLSAQLRYQSLKNEVDHLDQEKTSLSNQLVRLAGTELEYESALSEKERHIQQSDQIASRELLGISEELAYLNFELKELTEAVSAGKSVLTDLGQLIKSLESAEGWGIWDMLGGGLFSNAIKYSHIDDAQASVNNIQKKIGQFKRELADVKQSVDIQIDIDGLTSFADFFFDGLIVDWIVQSKIEKSLAQSTHARNVITQVIKKLEVMKEIIQGRCNILKENRALLIERT